MASGRDTLTVLFTDIEASTVMRNTLGDDRADVVVGQHDDVVARCADEHDGRLVKHTGDGAMISFRSARSAVECAVAIQRSLRALTEQGRTVAAVRIGMNAGEVTVTDDGDLFGQAVNAAARVAGHGDGGDIVVSDVIRHLIGHQPGLDFVDLGSHELAGFDDPWPLYSVSWRQTVERREIRLLGEVRVSLDGRRIEDGASPRALLVLAALALAGGRRVDRGQLAFRLWPESTDRQARTNLRKVLHELRAWLPDDGWVEIDQRRARLRTEHVLVDVDEFRSAADRGDDRSAAAYGGTLLPGYWDEWVLEERRALEDLAVDSLRRHLADTDEPDERIQAAQRLLQLDRVDEVAHRNLIEAHALAGNRSAALRAFHTCTTVLERELGVAPSPETVAVYEALRVGGGSAENAASGARSGPRRAGPPLIGRDHELRWLFDRWRIAAAGSRLAALLFGEVGIGKSRLVDELASRCERDGHIVLRSRAYESDGGRTLAPVVDWLRHDPVAQAIDRLAPHHRTELGRLLPEHASTSSDQHSGDPAETRARLFDAAAAALAGVGRPLLLVLDDLQWCGPDTVDFVSHLLHRGPTTGLLLAATRRDHERPADHSIDRKLADLRADHQLEDRRLARLRPAHTEAIARAATDTDWSSNEVAQLHVETDGNPLFVIEAARAGPGGDHVTPTVQGVIQRRILQLTDDQRTLLDVASVFGRRFGSHQLALAARRDEDDVIDTIDELWRLGLVVEDGAGFDLGHDLFREVIVASISPARCGRLHRRIAAALVETAGGDLGTIADRLAEHYERGGLLDEAVDALASAAGRAAAIGAHAQAIQRLEHGLDLLAERDQGPERDARELRLLTDLGTALAVQAGYGSPETQRTWDRAAALCRDLGTSLSGPVLRGLALAALSDCRFERAAVHGEALCRLDDPVARLEGHYVLGVTRFWQGDFRRAERHLRRVLDEYDPSASVEHRSLYGQDPHAVCGCRLAYLRVLQGRAREGDALLAQAEALAGSLDDSLTAWYVHTYRVIIDQFVCRPTTRPPPCEPVSSFFAATDQKGTLWWEALGGSVEAHEAIEAITDKWRDPGHHLLLTMWLARLAELRLRVGDPAAALVHLDEAETFARQRGQGYLVSELTRLRAHALRLQDDPGRAQVAAAAVEEAEAMDAAGLVLRARTELLRCTGDPTTAATLSAELDALSGSHDGQDLDDARAALAVFAIEVLLP